MSIVKFPKVSPTENQFSVDGKVWWVPSLIEASRSLPQFPLHLGSVDTGRNVWGELSVWDIAAHVARCRDVDISKPVILSQEGFIMDGWHRVLRGLIDGLETIPAVRFQVTPKHDRVED